MVEVVIPAGMVAWAGGDHAPADWDAMAPVKWAVPQGYAETGVKQDEQPWKHGSVGWYDIIAYTPRADAKVSERERVALAIVNQIRVDHDLPPCTLDELEDAEAYLRQADAILATLRAGVAAGTAVSEQSADSRERPAPSINARPKRYLSDRFKWAAPGDQQEDAWLVRFCDRDCGDAVFTGPEAEQEAWAYWERYAPSFNIYVFRLAALAPAAGGEGL